MEIYGRAMASCENGDYEAAVADFRWLHDHPDDASQEYRMMRCGYVLTSWITLGHDRYPPALTALQEVLESKRARLRNGEITPSLPHDIDAIESRLSQIAGLYERT